MPGAGSPDDIVFETDTPLGFSVRSTSSYWATIVQVKHPVMKGRMKEVVRTLAQPDEVRVSRSDNRVFLFYRQVKPSRWICAVAKRLNGDGFLITTYPTDAIKEGHKIWPK